MLSRKRFAFEDGANAHDVGEVLARYRLDAKTPLADRIDEAARGEPRQSLAQRSRADAIARRGFHDSKAAVGRERADQDVRLDALRGALGQGVRVGARQGRTSLFRSMVDCSMSCCFMVSTHQAKSEPFSSGLEISGRVRRTRSIGILVNFAIDCSPCHDRN